MSEELSLQEKYSPNGRCFGCGPANAKGLRVRSFPVGEEVVSNWHASDHHEAFPGMLCGGIVGSLLDCHSNWTAAWHLMNRLKKEAPPCTVTAEYAVKLHRPTPMNKEIQLIARVAELTVDRATIEAILEVDNKLCASCRGVFVAVKPGHPAYHRW